jgi:negative regulator of flagellin synthesis FlgM
MQINGPAHVHGPQAVNSPHRAHPSNPSTPTDSVSQADQLDISPEADLVSRAREIPDVRQGLVDRIRSEIQAGTYDTDEKLDLAMDRLLDEIGD